MRLTVAVEILDAPANPETCCTVWPYRYSATSSISLKAPTSAGSVSFTFFIVVDGKSVATTTAAERGNASAVKNLSCCTTPSSYTLKSLEVSPLNQLA